MPSKNNPLPSGIGHESPAFPVPISRHCTYDLAIVPDNFIPNREFLRENVTAREAADPRHHLLERAGRRDLLVRRSARKS